MDANVALPLSEKEQAELRIIRGLRHGIYESMQRIRKQLMVPDVFDDPTILPMESIEAGLLGPSSGVVFRPMSLAAAAYASHQHSIRWSLRQTNGPGRRIEYTRP